MNGMPVARARKRKVALAFRLLALLVGRRIEGDAEFRAGGAGGSGRLDVPDVLADQRRNPHAADLDDDRVAARSEVPLLVEHLVVRQPLLAVARDAGAVAQPRRAVVDRVGGVLRVADQEIDAARRIREAREALLDAAAEPAVEQQVLGRIARQRELGRDQERRALLLRLGDPRDDAVRVARRVADGGVDLSERYTQQVARLVKGDAPLFPKDRRKRGASPFSRRAQLIAVSASSCDAAPQRVPSSCRCRARPASARCERRPPRARRTCRRPCPCRPRSRRRHGPCACRQAR